MNDKKQDLSVQRNFTQHNPPTGFKAEPMTADTFPWNAKLVMRLRVYKDEVFTGTYGWVIITIQAVYSAGVVFIKDGMEYKFLWAKLLEKHPDQENESVDTPYQLYWSTDGRNCYPCIKGSEDHLCDGITPFYSEV